MANLSAIETAFQALSLNNPTTTPTSRSSAIQSLGLASKSHPEIRSRLGHPDVLKTLIETLEISLQDSLETADLALRCIANASADNDQARDEIVAIGFSWALLCLRSDHDEIRLLVTKVLYNVCTNHEAAQKACYEARVHYAVLEFCESKLVQQLGVEDSEIIGDLLFLISGHKAALDPTLTEPLPGTLLSTLLNLPRLLKKNLDVETNATNIEIVVVFLRDATIQNQVINERRVTDVRALLQDHEALVSMLKRDHEGSEDDIKLLAPFSSSLVWCLSDIAANPSFAKQYSLEDSLFQDVIASISGGNGGTAAGGSTLTADCHLLTNLLWAMSPDSYATLAENTQLSGAILERIAHSDAGILDMDALHAMAGLLTMLSRPSIRAREAIGGNIDAQEALRRLCHHENPEIKKDGVKLIKALGAECPDNQRRFAELARDTIISLQAEAPNEVRGASLPS